MKINSGSKNGNLILYQKFKILERFLKISKPGIHVGSKGGNVLSWGGGTIGKYLRAKQSLDSNTNSL